MKWVFPGLLVCLWFSVSGQPAASFSINKYKVCSGKTIFLNNTSSGADKYAWYVDYSFYSSKFNDTLVIVDSCYKRHTIHLITTNTHTGISDTANKSIEVFGVCGLHLQTDPPNCVGDTIRLGAHPDAVSNKWTITPQHTFLSGCDTCSAISFILTILGTDVVLQSTYDGGCSQNTSYHYFRCNPFVNIIRHEESQLLTIYPNPARDKIFIRNKNSDPPVGITICTIAGVAIYTARGQITEVVDVSNLSKGLYRIEVEYIKGKASGMIIVE